MSAGAVAAHYVDTVAASYSAAVMAKTPAMYWKLDETSGTVGADSSGNSRNLTMNSPTAGVAWVSDSGVPGGRAWEQISNNGYNYSAYTGMLNTSALTLMGYVKLLAATQPGAAPTIIGKTSYYAISTSDFPISLRAVGSGTNKRFGLFIDAGGNFTQENIIEAPSDWATNTWYHVTGVFEGGSGKTSRLLINGTRVASLSTNFTLSTGTSVWTAGTMVDNSGGAGQSRIDGRMAQLAVFPSALTDAEVATIYAATAA